MDVADDHPNDRSATTSDSESISTLPVEVQRSLNQNPFASEPTYTLRPNRFFGPASTWRSWTEDDRAVADSLDQIRASDLSVHLFNSHALKQRSILDNKQDVRKQRSNHRAKSDQIDDQDLSEDQSFGPPKVWTAWPLPPDVVPRGISRPDTNSGIIRGEVDTRPSAGLENALIAFISKIAKQRWTARGWECESIPPPKREWVKEKNRSEAWDEQQGFKDEQSIGELIVQGLDLTYPMDTEDESSEGEESNADVPVFHSQAFAAVPDMNSEQNLDHTYDMSLKEYPVLMADEDRIRHILLPSARHIISRLDDLLTGLHKARLSYADGRYRSRSRSMSVSGNDTSASKTMSQKRRSQSRSASRSRKRMRQFPTGKKIEEDDTTTLHHLPQSRTREERMISSGLGLRDWSDVIGMATLTGWDLEVVGRASERCANLFGENMMFRTMHEGDPSSRLPAFFTEEFATVERDQIAGSPLKPLSSRSDNEEDVKPGVPVVMVRTSEACTRCQHRKTKCVAASVSSAAIQRRNSQIAQSCLACVQADASNLCSGILSLPEYLLPKDIQLTCPHPSCDRHGIPFKKQYHLQRHINNVHGGARPSQDGSKHKSDIFESSTRMKRVSLTCPVLHCQHYRKPFTRGTRLYEHVKTYHPEIDADELKKEKGISKGLESQARQKAKLRGAATKDVAGAESPRATVGKADQTDEVELENTDLEDEDEAADSENREEELDAAQHADINLKRQHENGSDASHESGGNAANDPGKRTPHRDLRPRLSYRETVNVADNDSDSNYTGE